MVIHQTGTGSSLVVHSWAYLANSFWFLNPDLVLDCEQVERLLGWPAGGIPMARSPWLLGAAGWGAGHPAREFEMPRDFPPGALSDGMEDMGFT